MNLIIGLIIFVGLLAIWFISVGNRLNRYLVTIEESKRTVDIVLVKRYFYHFGNAKSSESLCQT